MTKLLLSVQEAGAAIGVGRSKIYELIACGELESVKIGKIRRVPADALVAYVARLRDESRDAAIAN